MSIRILVDDAPTPTYPEFPQVEALARQITPRTVNPANLWPEREVMFRRGDDWCTAVLARPAYPGVWLSVHDQYLLIAADRLNIDPPLPAEIVTARHRAAEVEAAKVRRIQAAKQRDHDAWVAALQGATVDLAVYEGGRARARGALYEPNRHAVPHTDVYSGVRKVRVHPAGHALCESPTRARALELALSAEAPGIPATCDRCLCWVGKVRPTE